MSFRSSPFRSSTCQLRSAASTVAVSRSFSFIVITPCWCWLILLRPVTQAQSDGSSGLRGEVQLAGPQAVGGAAIRPAQRLDRLPDGERLQRLALLSLRHQLGAHPRAPFGRVPARIGHHVEELHGAVQLRRSHALLHILVTPCAVAAAAPCQHEQRDVAHWLAVLLVL